MVRNKNQNMPAFAHIDARGDVDLRALPVGHHRHHQVPPLREGKPLAVRERKSRMVRI